MTPKTVSLSKHIKQRPGAVEHRAFYLRIRDASTTRLQCFHCAYAVFPSRVSVATSLYVNLELCLRGKTPVRSLPFIGGGEAWLSSHMGLRYRNVQWNMRLLVPLVAKRFQWSSISRSVTIPISKTVKCVAIPSSSATRYKMIPSLTSPRRALNRKGMGRYRFFVGYLSHYLSSPRQQLLNDSIQAQSYSGIS